MIMDLSIIIITMNRAEQLAEAVHSCLACNLPEKTEIIIVDNASTDNTPVIATQLKRESKISIKFFRSEKNLGVGAGRNYALEHADGNIIYVLDDDAVIDDHNLNFFYDALKILDNHKDIATLTTQIYDTAWKANRLSNTNFKIADNLYQCYMPCGGSHFLRRAYFSDPIYFPNLYGYEEIATAIQAINKGHKNVFCDNLLVIHKPKVNKWNTKYNPRLYVNSFASQYAIKKTLYPRSLTPLLFIIYNLRYMKYLHGTGLRREGKELINKLTVMGKDFKRISFLEWLKLFKKFGVSII